MLNLLFSTLLLVSFLPVSEMGSHAVASWPTDPVIAWPEDFMICVTDTSQVAELIHPGNLFPPYAKPIVTGPCGSPYGISYDDQTYGFNQCRKVFRTWTVIDWCQYIPNRPNSPGKWTHVQVIKVIVKDEPIGPCGGV